MLKRKILALLLCVCMAVTVLPVTALAAEGDGETGTTPTEPTGPVVLTCALKDTNITKTYDGKTDLPAGVDVTLTGATEDAPLVKLTGKADEDADKAGYTISGSYADANVNTTPNNVTITVTLNAEALKTYTFTQPEKNPDTPETTADTPTVTYKSDSVCEIVTTGTITKAEREITVTSATASVDVGKTVTIKATNSITGDALKFSSANTDVATVNASTGVVTGVKPGTAEITIEGTDTANYTTKGTPKVTVTVNKIPVTLGLSAGEPAEIPGDNDSDPIKGYTVELTVSNAPADATVKVTCSPALDEGKLTYDATTKKATATLDPVAVGGEAKTYTFTATLDTNTSYAVTDGKCEVIITATGAHKHTGDNTWEKDETNHWHVCTDEDCPIAGDPKKYGEAAHTLSGWKNDTTKHWKECTVCGQKVQEAEHTYAAEGNTCENCGYEKGGTTTPVVRPPTPPPQHPRHPHPPRHPRGGAQHHGERQHG